MTQDFENNTNKYNSQKTALKIACYKLDIPFFASLYESLITNNNKFTIGMYTRICVNGTQYKHKDFSTSLLDGELSKTDNEVREEMETRLSRADKQNMNFAISIVGYDPFIDCGMSQADRRYCFNILAGYCDAEGIKEDGHKVQSIIQITQSQLQCRKVDELINSELLDSYPDEKRIKELTSTKKTLLDGIAKIAQDNNLSSNYNENSKKGANTLSNKMKEMAQNNFEAIKVNLFDIKTAEAMKQVADLSNRSILDQLTLDANDYTEMLKEQREMILKYEQNQDKLQEENRILKNKIQDLEVKKKR